MDIAFLGPEASFSHQAAIDHFGTSARFHPEHGIARVFDEVEKGVVEWGVVPVDNSLEGSVNVTLDKLVLTSLKIQAEIYLRISQCLISPSKIIKGLKCIFTPAGLAQCQAWLRANRQRDRRGGNRGRRTVGKGKKASAATGSRMARGWG